MKTYFFVLMGFLFILMNSCKKTPEIIPSQETGFLTDIEGNLYKTIKIGNQWWMAENLRVNRYRDSTEIYSVPNYKNITWDTITSGANCIYNDNINASGRLYNWYAVNDSHMVAPLGWHVPSDDEWKELEQFLGMSQPDADKVNWRGTHEGEKLKMDGKNVWRPFGDILPGNESGFSALPANCRIFNGDWGIPVDLQSTGFWWTSTENKDNNLAWYRDLDYKKANVFRFYGPKTYGFSIRCVKDK